MLKVTSPLLVEASSLYSAVEPTVTSALPLLVWKLYVPLIVEGIWIVSGPLLVSRLQFVASKVPVMGPLDVLPLRVSAFILSSRSAPLLVWIVTLPPLTLLTVTIPLLVVRSRSSLALAGSFTSTLI